MRPATYKQKAAIYSMLRSGHLTHDADGPIEVESLTIGMASSLIAVGIQRRTGKLGFGQPQPKEESVSFTPTVCLDFDGVIHSYASGWRGVTVIPDPPVEGAYEAIRSMQDQGYKVVVFSTRANSEAGLMAINDYLHDMGVEGVEVHSKKPKALIYVDDRGYRFGGRWEPLLRLLEDQSDLRPWNKQ